MRLVPNVKHTYSKQTHNNRKQKNASVLGENFKMLGANMLEGENFQIRKKLTTSGCIKLFAPKEPTNPSKISFFSVSLFKPVFHFSTGLISTFMMRHSFRTGISFVLKDGSMGFLEDSIPHICRNYKALSKLLITRKKQLQ